MLFLPILLTAVGGWFLVVLRGGFFLCPRRAFGLLSDGFSRGGRRTVRSFFLALAGTLGVGNVTGVAVALRVGGAGSIFWMAIAALFACVLKFCESVLTASLGAGDMSDAIRAAFPKSPLLPALYVATLALTAFPMGAVLQLRAVAETANATLSVPPIVSAVCMSALIAPVILGGGGRIERASAMAIPPAALAYLLLCVLGICRAEHTVGEVLGRIFDEAFRVRSALGGWLALFCSRAVREGYAIGLLSNEAGCGTCTFAHARDEGLSAAEGGLLGVLEVACDALLCALTGVFILAALGGADLAAYPSAMHMLCDGFRITLGGGYRLPLLFCLSSFAFATSICWYYYGCTAVRALCGRRAIVYPYLYLGACLLSGVWNSALAVRLTDGCLLVLGLLSLPTLLRFSGRIRAISMSVGLMPHLPSRDRRRRNICRAARKNPKKY